MEQFDSTATTVERCASSMKKSGRLAIAAIGVIIGIVLLFIGNRSGQDETNDKNAPTYPVAEATQIEDYRLALEARMEEICSEVVGVGEVSVIVTLEGGYEYVYAYDRKVTSSGENTTYITVGNGANESLVYITERAPTILGIGVVCTGGMDASVRQELMGLLSAAFGVGSHKIYITGHK